MLEALTVSIGVEVLSDADVNVLAGATTALEILTAIT